MFNLISLATFCLLSSNGQEIRQQNDYVIRLPKPVRINAGMYYTSQALVKAKIKPGLYPSVHQKTSQIFSWHNIIYQVVYEEKWKTDRVYIGSELTEENLMLMLKGIGDYARGKKLIDVHTATLIINMKTTSVIKGMARFKGISTVCEIVANIGSSQSYRSWLGAIAIARHVGRCLGLNFETEGLCINPDNSCIMNPSMKSWFGKSPPAFSSVSIEMLLTFDLTSLQNTPDVYKNLHPFCGNGIVEKNEECDCGFLEACVLSGLDECCDYKTCKLKKGSQCANGPCCKHCNFTKGNICRKKRDSLCDIVEFCSGKSEKCPRDNFKTDGLSCGINTYCINGECQTSSAKCSAIANKHITSDDTCRGLLPKIYDSKRCQDSGSVYCLPSINVCSFVACNTSLDLLEAEKSYYNGASCNYMTKFMPSMANTNTDGLSCGSNHLCIHGECIDSRNNFKLCQNLHCSSAMACKMGRCYRMGATGTDCQDVNCLPYEVCVNGGECRQIKDLFYGKDEILYRTFFALTIATFIHIAIAFILFRMFFELKEPDANPQHKGNTHENT